jgi:2-succinyl-6-hydroxy-2,4-cyclohexadiene-1-carboxylate synthase
VTGFDEMSALLDPTLISYNILNYWLVGYSLGGRIAMFHACQQPKGLCGLIVEGGHPGLQDADARLRGGSPTAAGQRVFASTAGVCFC